MTLATCLARFFFGSAGSPPALCALPPVFSGPLPPLREASSASTLRRHATVMEVQVDARDRLWQEDCCYCWTEEETLLPEVAILDAVGSF